MSAKEEKGFTTKQESQDKQERNQGDVLTIETTNDNNLELFDDKEGESFPDVTIALPNDSQHLTLHRVILGKASKGLGAAFRGKPALWGAYDMQSRHLEWKVCCDSAVEGLVLRKWLHFCYGSEMKLSVNEAVAGLWVLTKLNLQKEEMLGSVIQKFIAPDASRDLETEVLLLKQCIAYGQNSDKAFDAVTERLTKRVLTRGNIVGHFSLVVDHCLMELPPVFLDKAEYGEVWTEFSEFELRRHYIERHKNDLGAEEKDKIMNSCKEVIPNSGELKKMVEQSTLSKDSLLLIFQKALEQCEKERDAQKARADSAEATIARMEEEAKQRDEAMKAIQSKEQSVHIEEGSLFI